jgi:sulfate adenylyltransferase subunit 2
MSYGVSSELESESIEIIREVAATARKPVMLYSIGKDSSVMLRLAQKAFYPAPISFPLMHIDTGWKFREMIAFRDRTARELGFELITYTNPRGIAEGIGPITHGSGYHTDVMKTEALKQALDLHGFDFVFGGARRDEENRAPRNASFPFAPRPTPGTRRTSVRSCGTC